MESEYLASSGHLATRVLLAFTPFCSNTCTVSKSPDAIAWWRTCEIGRPSSAIPGETNETAWVNILGEIPYFFPFISSAFF